MLPDHSKNRLRVFPSLFGLFDSNPKPPRFCLHRAHLLRDCFPRLTSNRLTLSCCHLICQDEHANALERGALHIYVRFSLSLKPTLPVCFVPFVFPNREMTLKPCSMLMRQLVRGFEYDSPYFRFVASRLNNGVLRSAAAGS